MRSIGLAPRSPARARRARRSSCRPRAAPARRRRPGSPWRRRPSSTPEVDDGLRDLRPDAADDAVGAHQPGGRDRLDQMLRHQRVDGRHAGDVDDGDLGAGVDDALQQVLHHHLRARAVERADQRQREDAVPELDDRRRQLQQFLLLARDDLLAGPLVALRWCRGRAGPAGASHPVSKSAS